MKHKGKGEPPHPWPKHPEMVNATPNQVAFAFEEWERRFRNEPDKFMQGFHRFTQESPKSYGEMAADYFIKLLAGEI